jgi:predicted TIM-barrel fold metal-dependent hydrolase
VPVVLHFEHEKYNFHIERFYKILEKFPKVNFIGHAQTWWGNIDKNHNQTVMYPKGKVTPGGISDRYLSGYANMYADLSAGSGQNALTRDEEHARGFLDRHQDKLLFGSDCSDWVGEGEKCSGATTLSILRRLAPSPQILKKLLHDNATRIMRIA